MAIGPLGCMACIYTSGICTYVDDTCFCAVGLQSAAAAAAAAVPDQSLIDRMLMQTCGREDKSSSCSQSSFQLCTSPFGFTQEQVHCTAAVHGPF